MKVLALTGGVAAGKSTVAGMFAELGAKILDADAIAHGCYAPGTPLHAEILKKFGANLEKPDGSIDRKALGAQVFRSAEAKAWLEAHTHQATRHAIDQEISRLRNSGVPLILVEAALHVETGFFRHFEGLIVVHVNPEIQLKRLMERNGISEAEATLIIKNQMPVEVKRKYADWVIDNSGSLEQTRQRVEELYGEWTGS